MRRDSRSGCFFFNGIVTASKIRAPSIACLFALTPSSCFKRADRGDMTGVKSFSSGAAHARRRKSSSYNFGRFSAKRRAVSPLCFSFSCLLLLLNLHFCYFIKLLLHLLLLFVLSLIYLMLGYSLPPISLKIILILISAILSHC
jgi:hypothetical protein